MMFYLIVLIMQLWEATLSHAPTMVPQLLACFSCLVEIIERSFDHLQVRLVELVKNQSFSSPVIFSCNFCKSSFNLLFVSKEKNYSTYSYNP